MNYKESISIVKMLHSAFPSDRKATPGELMERAKGYAVTFADENVLTVKAAAEYIIRTSNWYPTTKEILEAVKRSKISEVTPITQAEPIHDAELEEYIEAFCEWIGFEGEPNDKALDNYYEQYPERLEKMKGWLKYEE